MKKSPATVEWSARFSIGHDKLDNQHKKLLQLIHKVDRLSGQSFVEYEEDFHLILNELSLYAKHHFAEEEKVMEQLNYPGLQVHKDEHLEFIEDLSELLMATIDGKHDIIKLQQFLNDWWVTHIRLSDLHLKAFTGAD